MPHPEDTFIKDTTGSRGWELTAEKKIDYERQYLEVMQGSYFVLCPRGVGPCTYRLFETLQLGRVPVIISDAWLKVPGIDWDRFSITIPENKINCIPSLLNNLKGDAVEMGKVARHTWETSFSPGVSLRELSYGARLLIQHRYNLLDSLKDHSQFLRDRWHFKNLLRSKIKPLLREVLKQRSKP